MHEKEDWLFRPVLNGMFTADKLLDGSVDLEFILLCNEALDTNAENDYRQKQAEALNRERPHG